MWPLDIPTRKGINTWQVFFAPPSTTTTNSWNGYEIPFGATQLFIIMIGAGGGGGKGAGGVATVAPGGGGSGGVTRLIIPTFCLPRTLYVRPGVGGAGATVSGSGATGTLSHISVQPNSVTQNIILTQGGGGGGGGGATSTAGSSGAGETVVGSFLSMGLYRGLAGQAGTAGAVLVDTAGTAISPGAVGLFISGGTGGGNGTGAGGALTGLGLYPTIPGGVGTTGGNGNHGYNIHKPITPNAQSCFPLLFTGGSGGGGHSTGQAGTGGDGAYGCGGGGGGNTSGVGGTAGNGGNGGDGLILIGAF